MGKSSPKPPAAPDYAAAATAQGAANKDAAIAGAVLGNPNVISPYGNQTVNYANNPVTGTPQPTITQTLTPAAQQTLDSQQQVQLGLANLGQQGIGTAQGLLGTPFEANLPNLQTSLGGGEPARTSLDTSGVAAMPVNAGMTGQQALMSRLQPQLQQNENANYQRLANQGITQGSEAWGNSMREQGQQRNDLELQAASQGIGLDMQANNQGFNQALQGAGLYNSGQAQNWNQGLGGAQFGNTAIQNSLQQQLALRNQPINEITALMNGSQIQNPQFQQYQGQAVQAAPLFQGVQQQAQDAMQRYGIQANQAASNQAGLFGGLGSLAGMFF